MPKLKMTADKAYWFAFVAVSQPLVAICTIKHQDALFVPGIAGALCACAARMYYEKKEKRDAPLV